MTEDYETEEAGTGVLDGLSTVTEEMAKQEFDRMLKAARVKWDKYVLYAGGRDAENERDLIVDNIMDGIVTINDLGFPTLRTPHKHPKLAEIKIFRRPISADKLMMDKEKEGHEIAKERAVVAKFLGITPSLISQLEEVDETVLKTLWHIFLGYRV